MGTAGAARLPPRASMKDHSRRAAMEDVGAEAHAAAGVEHVASLRELRRPPVARDVVGVSQAPRLELRVVALGEACPRAGAGASRAGASRHLDRPAPFDGGAVDSRRRDHHLRRPGCQTAHRAEGHVAAGLVDAEGLAHVRPPAAGLDFGRPVSHRHRHLRRAIRRPGPALYDHLVAHRWALAFPGPVHGELNGRRLAHCQARTLFERDGSRSRRQRSPNRRMSS